MDPETHQAYPGGVHRTSPHVTAVTHDSAGVVRRRARVMSTIQSITFSPTRRRTSGRVLSPTDGNAVSCRARRFCWSTQTESRWCIPGPSWFQLSRSFVGIGFPSPCTKWAIGWSAIMGGIATRTCGSADGGERTGRTAHGRQHHMCAGSSAGRSRKVAGMLCGDPLKASRRTRVCVLSSASRVRWPILSHPFVF